MAEIKKNLLLGERSVSDKSIAQLSACSKLVVYFQHINISISRNCRLWSNVEEAEALHQSLGNDFDDPGMASERLIADKMLGKLCERRSGRFYYLRC